MQQSDERTAWELVPFESVGPLRLGMSNAEVAAALAEAPTQRPPTPGLPPLATTQETFTGAGIRAVYDAEGRLIAVEAFDRALVYCGVTLDNDRSMDKVAADLRKIDVSVSQHDPAGPDAWSIGVLFTVEPGGEVSAAMAVRRDYRQVTGS